MGVSFTRKKIISTKVGNATVVSETEMGTLPPIFSNRLSDDMKSKKVYEPIPSDYPILVPMGYEGPTIKFVGYFSGDKVVAYNAWSKVHPMHILTVASNTASHDGVPGGDGAVAYLELPVGSQWWVDSRLIDRQAGWMNRWSIDLVLIRRWRDINGVYLPGVTATEA